MFSHKNTRRTFLCLRKRALFAHTGCIGFVLPAVLFAMICPHCEQAGRRTQDTARGLHLHRVDYVRVTNEFYFV